MKKTFPLHSPGKENQRVVEAIKNDVRKYVKRERRKPLPEGVDFLDFDCKVGPDNVEPAVKHLAEVTSAIDAVAAGGGTGVYVEILSKPGHRARKATEPLPGGNAALSAESQEIPGGQGGAPTPPTDTAG